MDGETALLASLPPSAWNETLRRMEVIISFRDIAAPNGQDIRNHAAALRLNPRSFYRLIRAYENLSAGVMPTGSRRGSKRSLRQEADDIVEKVRSEMGREAPERLVLIEIGKRCAAAGIEAPSLSALRTRDAGAAVDLRIRLRRRFDLVVDACPLDIDVFDESNSGSAEAVAWLTGLLDGATGMVLGHMVTAGEPRVDRMQELLEAGAGSDGDPRVLISTGTLPDVMPSALGDGGPTDLTFDAAASRGLLPGAALVPALGLKVGTVSLKARRHKPFGGKAVPIGVARRLLDHMLGADRE